MCLYVCLSHADIVSKRLNGYSQIESQKSYVLYPWVTLNSNKPPILALFVPFHIVVWVKVEILNLVHRWVVASPSILQTVTERAWLRHVTHFKFDGLKLEL